MLKKISDVFLSPAQSFYLFVLCIFLTVPFWPPKVWWLANLLVIAPLWLLLLPVGLFILAAIFLKDWRGVALNAISLVVILFGILGFNVTWPFAGTAAVDPSFSMKVITVNMGSVKDPEPFLQMVVAEKPDLIAFQELYPQIEERVRSALVAGGWVFKAQGYLALASRFRVRSIEVKDRRPYGGWGNIVARYELETPVGLVHFFDVHLETPREGVEALLYRRSDAVSEMQRVAAIQAQESVLAATFTADYSPVIVAGDFNLTRANPLFHSNWSGLTDTFSQRGMGFGNTKHTRWYGARIDRVLVDGNWQTLESRVGSDIRGDHHPLISRIVFTGEPSVLPPSVSQSSGGPLADDSSEETPVKSEFDGVAFKEWGLDPFPMVSFLYKIDPGTPVVMRVKTSWGDWLCLGGSKAAQCSEGVVREQTALIDDNMWHKAKIDVRAAVQSVLPGVKALTEFRFQDPAKGRLGAGVLISEMKIFAAE